MREWRNCGKCGIIDSTNRLAKRVPESAQVVEPNPLDDSVDRLVGELRVLLNVLNEIREDFMVTQYGGLVRSGRVVASTSNGGGLIDSALHRFPRPEPELMA